MKLGNGFIYYADCFDILATLPDASVDMFMLDPPYGTVNWQCPEKWDHRLPFAKLWPELWRVLKPVCSIAICGNEPFSTLTKASQMERYKYDYVWVKSKSGGFANAKVKPLRKYESVSIFSAGTTSPGRNNNMRYYPQGLEPYGKVVKNSGKSRMGMTVRTNAVKEYTQEFTNYPSDVWDIAGESGLHPTQKPVELFERLIRTYTQEGDLVVDLCAGSGTTAVACERSGRRWMLVEQNTEYFQAAFDRINALSMHSLAMSAQVSMFA